MDDVDKVKLQSHSIDNNWPEWATDSVVNNNRFIIYPKVAPAQLEVGLDSRVTTENSWIMLQCRQEVVFTTHESAVCVDYWRFSQFILDNNKLMTVVIRRAFGLSREKAAMTLGSQQRAPGFKFKLQSTAVLKWRQLLGVRENDQTDHWGGWLLWIVVVDGGSLEKKQEWTLDRSSLHHTHLLIEQLWLYWS